MSTCKYFKSSNGVTGTCESGPTVNVGGFWVHPKAEKGCHCRFHDDGKVMELTDGETLEIISPQPFTEAEVKKLKAFLQGESVAYDKFQPVKKPLTKRQQAVANAKKSKDSESEKSKNSQS